LLGLSNKLGSLDWSDPEEVGAVGEEFADMIRFLREHATNENLFQIPPLEERSPGATRKMAEDHELLEKVIDRLEADWKKSAANPGPEGYQLYMTFNRFLSGYLAHMDMEEGEVTSAMHHHFTDPEIGAMVGRIVARISPQDMAMMLRYILPGMNDGEREVFLLNLKAGAPPQVFMGVKGLAQKVLAPKDWDKLSASLG
jgi:hypothetical protein